MGCGQSAPAAEQPKEIPATGKEKPKKDPFSEEKEEPTKEEPKKEEPKPAEPAPPPKLPPPERVKAEPKTKEKEEKAPLEVGEEVFVLKEGGFQATVINKTTTDVQVKKADGTEIWCEMEDLQHWASGPPMASEVKVGEVVRTSTGVTGKVLKRTTTEVCLQTSAGAEAWVDIEDVSFLKVTILGAQNLRNTDWGSKSDPYVICSLQEGGDEGKIKTKVQTKYVSDNLNPTWDQEFTFIAYDEGDILHFEVWDKDINTIKKDDFLGKASLTSDNFHAGCFYGDLELMGECGTKPAQGTLKIKVQHIGAKPPEPPKEEPDDAAPEIEGDATTPKCELVSGCTVS